jgi:Reverse transcriptase (RNA-dependent DNA polymerase)
VVITLSQEQTLYVSEYLNNLILEGQIALCKSPRYILEPFVITQKDGKKRVCFDPSKLGRCIANSSFKMKSAREAKMYMRKGIYMEKIDLKDAYHLIPVCVQASRFSVFRHPDTFWSWKALPFGLFTAPRLSSKIMKAALSALCLKGIQFVQYLVDILVFGRTEWLAQRYLATIAKRLMHLGFAINLKKSIIRAT